MRAELAATTSWKVPSMEEDHKPQLLLGKRVEQGPAHIPTAHFDPSLRNGWYVPTMDQDELLSERQWVVQQLLNVGKPKPDGGAEKSARRPTSAMAAAMLSHSALSGPLISTQKDKKPRLPKEKDKRKRLVERRPGTAQSSSVGTPHRPGYVRHARKDPLWNLSKRPPTGSKPGPLEYGGDPYSEEELAVYDKLKGPSRPDSSRTVEIPNCERMSTQFKPGPPGRNPDGSYNPTSVKRLYGWS